MAQVLDTIEGYIANVRKKDTIFVGFNAEYAKVFLRIKKTTEDEPFMSWLDTDKTNWEKREEFIQFMAKELPDVQYCDVFDYVPPSYLQWPFLGTIALDIEAGGEVERLLNSKYENEEGKPISLDTVIYIMSYKDAVRRWKIRDEHERMEYE